MEDQGAHGDGQRVPTQAWSSTATLDPPRPPAPPATSTPRPPSGGPGRGAPWWLVVVVALIAALVTGGAVFAWSRFASAGPRTTALTADDQKVLLLSQELQSMQAELTRTKAELDALKNTAASTTKTSPAQPPSETSASSQQYTLIDKVYQKGGAWYITADYVQFLTGAAANAAATAHGDESPPPNDYYIVNDNKQLRELPVTASANVKIMGGEGGDPANPRNQSISTFHDWYYSGDTAKNWVKGGIYVLTLSGGKVTAIDQQFIP